MKTFETFLIEVDEMSLGSRVASGQINSREAKILTDRRAERAKLPGAKTGNAVKPSTPSVGSPAGKLAIYKPPGPGGKPGDPAGKLALSNGSGALVKPNPSSSFVKPNRNVGALKKSIEAKPLVNVPQKPSLSSKPKSRNRVLDFVKNAAKETAKDMIKDTIKGAVSRTKKAFTPDKPNVGVSQASDLGGPQKFGVATR